MKIENVDNITTTASAADQASTASHAQENVALRQIVGHIAYTQDRSGSYVDPWRKGPIDLPLAKVLTEVVSSSLRGGATHQTITLSSVNKDALESHIKFNAFLQHLMSLTPLCARRKANDADLFKVIQERYIARKQTDQLPCLIFADNGQGLDGDFLIFKNPELQLDNAITNKHRSLEHYLHDARLIDPREPYMGSWSDAIEALSALNMTLVYTRRADGISIFMGHGEFGVRKSEDGNVYHSGARLLDEGRRFIVNEAADHLADLFGVRRDVGATGLTQIVPALRSDLDFSGLVRAALQALKKTRVLEQDFRLTLADRGSDRSITLDRNSDLAEVQSQFAKSARKWR